MTNPSTEAWTALVENFTQTTQVMENLTVGPSLSPPLDLSNWVEALTLLTTNLSIILSVFLLLIFRCIVRTKEDFVVYLVQFLAVIDIFFCIGMDLGIAYYSSSDKEKYESFCVVESFICTFFDLVSFFYTIYVIIYVFSVTVYKSEWMKCKKAKCMYHSLAWGIPAMIAIPAASMGALGDAKSRFGSWCWIEDAISNKERLLWMLLTKQIWEILIYLLSAFLIVLTIWLKRRNRRMEEQSRSRLYHSPEENYETLEITSRRTRNTPNFNVMVWVLFYFYFTRIWGTTRNMVRIVGLAVGSTVPGFVPWDEKFFIHAQSVGDSMQGTMNFLMFCYCDDKVWRQVRNKLCCWTQDDDMDSATIPILENNISNKSYR